MPDIQTNCRKGTQAMIFGALWKIEKAKQYLKNEVIVSLITESLLIMLITSSCGIN